MKSNFNCGIDYAVAGIGDFYRNPFLWKYVVVPWLVLSVLYISTFTAICRYLTPYISEKITQVLSGSIWASFSGTLGTILIVLVWIMTILFLALSSNCIFEITGALFFPRMIREYERKILGLDLPPLKPGEIIRNMFDSFGLSLTIIFCFILLSLLILVLPLIGFIIFIVLMGYLYSMMFMSEACFNRKCRLSDIKYIFIRKKGMMYGFGTFAFFLLQIPLLSLFLYPGFMLGGSRMFHTEIYRM